jgi:hypothetical protein
LLCLLQVLLGFLQMLQSNKHPPTRQVSDISTRIKAAQANEEKPKKEKREASEKAELPSLQAIQAENAHLLSLAPPKLGPQIQRMTDAQRKAWLTDAKAWVNEVKPCLAGPVKRNTQRGNKGKGKGKDTASENVKWEDLEEYIKRAGAFLWGPEALKEVETMNRELERLHQLGLKLLHFEALGQKEHTSQPGSLQLSLAGKHSSRCHTRCSPDCSTLLPPTLLPLPEAVELLEEAEEVCVAWPKVECLLLCFSCFFVGLFLFSFVLFCVFFFAWFFLFDCRYFWLVVRFGVALFVCGALLCSLRSQNGRATQVKGQKTS